MESAKKILDISERRADYKWIYDETFRTDSGLRAILFMYDDHSDDKKSYDNILKQIDNINYRLFSATHQYLVFLRELSGAEDYLQTLYQQNPHYVNSFPMGNPFFDKVELELSSVFDNIIFQVSSVFDYLSHIVSYLIFKDKSKTVYWTKLAKCSRGQNNELANDEIKKIIDNVDRRFAGRLYDYRSRLLHNSRDKHVFGGHRRLDNSQFILQLLPSEIALKHFKNLLDDISSDSRISLTYLASWVIKRTFIEIESILDVLSIELKRNSHFGNNLWNPKRGMDSLIIISRNPETNRAEPVSESMWKKYKNKARG